MRAGTASASRAQVLKALGVVPLRLRARPARAEAPVTLPESESTVVVPTAPATLGKCIALLRAQAEINQPALASLYTKITEAISALGLQCVRIADAESDPRVRVLAFGAVPLPATIDSARVLRVDALATLDADRTRKRALWELMQKLAREAGGA